MLSALLVASFLFFDGQEALQKQGMQALDRGDYQTAVQVFSKITLSDSQDYTAFFNLALAETSLHDDAHAIEHFERSLTLKPNLYEAELNLGIVFLRNARAAEAVPLLQQAAKERPKESRPERYLADALLNQSDWPGAESAYRQAAELDPQSGIVQLGWGQSLQKQGKLDEALSHYRRATALDPKLQSYLLELAGAFEKNNEPAQAIALLKEFPSDPAAEEELGRLYLINQQPDLAVESFKAAVAASPTPANQLALATAYLKNQQYALAAPILEQALAASPADYELRMVVGRLHRDRHDYRNASAQFLAAAQLKPDSVDAWNEAASAFVANEQYPQAIAALDRIHSLNAETAGDFYYRAICLDKLHQLKPAIASYHRFLELSGGKFPDQEFLARQRSKTLEHEVNR